MADDYTFKNASGTDKTARADEFAAGQLLPFVGALSAVADVVGFETKHVSTASAGSLTVPTNATHALAVIDTGGSVTGIRFREDATNPTASVGLYIAAGNAVEWSNLADIRIIALGATATVQISYRRYDQ
jgi:hypothetical protein